MKKITIKKIAAMANVSYSTVSRALNEEKGVSVDVRERILQLCQEQGYHFRPTRKKSSAKDLSQLIGVIIPDVTSPFYASVLLHLEHYFREKGYTTLLCNSLYDDSKSEMLIESFIRHEVNGIILASTRDATCAMAEKFLRKLPVVYIGENPGEYTGNFVNTDNIRGGGMACDYLAKLGHQSVIYAGVRRNSATHAKRIEGFKKVAQELAIHVTVVPNLDCSSSIEGGYQIGKQIFGKKMEETAIFAASDTLALGMMQAAAESGIWIPEDVSLLGFDDIRYSNLPNIQLTTIAQPKKLLATTAADILIDTILRKEDSGFVSRALKPYLVERKTCQRKGK